MTTPTDPYYQDCIEQAKRRPSETATTDDILTFDFVPYEASIQLGEVGGGRIGKGGIEGISYNAMMDRVPGSFHATTIANDNQAPPLQIEPSHLALSDLTPESMMILLLDHRWGGGGDKGKDGGGILAGGSSGGEDKKTAEQEEEEEKSRKNRELEKLSDKMRYAVELEKRVGELGAENEGWHSLCQDLMVRSGRCGVGEAG